MKDNKNVGMETEGPWIITLTDEETHEDIDFQVIADEKVGEKNYYALIRVGDPDNEVIILEYREDKDGVVLETVEDDDEYEIVEDYFNDLLFGEVNYDEEGND